MYIQLVQLVEFAIYGNVYRKIGSDKLICYTGFWLKLAMECLRIVMLARSLKQLNYKFTLLKTSKQTFPLGRVNDGFILINDLLACHGIVSCDFVANLSN